MLFEEPAFLICRGNVKYSLFAQIFINAKHDLHKILSFALLLLHSLSLELCKYSIVH